MIILLAGKMTSGKTTLAKALSQDYWVKRMSFADPIRKALTTLGITKEEHPLLYREGAQFLGSDLVRSRYPDWWVEQMDKRIRLSGLYILEDHTNIVIDDCRYENELRWGQSKGALTVYLNVSRGTQLARGAQMDRLDHDTETGLDHIPEKEYDLWLPESTTVAERVQAVADALSLKTWAY